MKAFWNACPLKPFGPLSRRIRFINLLTTYEPAPRLSSTSERTGAIFNHKWPKHIWAAFKTLGWHGWLIGILTIMACERIPNWVGFHPLYIGLSPCPVTVTFFISISLGSGIPKKTPSCKPLASWEYIHQITRGQSATCSTTQATMRWASPSSQPSRHSPCLLMFAAAGRSKTPCTFFRGWSSCL